MSSLLYSVFLFSYKIGLYLASPFNPKAREFLHGRQQIWEQTAEIARDNSPRIWVHCASLGEFEQGRPVIESLRKKFPNYKIVLTFFSPSGFSVRKKYQGADYILYLPLDSYSNASRWVNSINPALAIFIKYEFWHHYIQQLHQKNIPILSVSSLFRSGQIYFRPYGKFQRKILSRVSHFFVQDDMSRKLLNNTGIEQVTVSGDTRFDRVLEIKKNRREIPEAQEFRGNSTVMVAGSVWPEDMEVLIPFINNHALKFIIAPHEINQRLMEKIENDIQKTCVRFSQWKPGLGRDADVLIIDNIGMLSSLYAYGDYAWVGGAYGHGLHNILEAAVYGCPVFFGNKQFNKFREARDLINLGGASSVENYMELKEQFAIFSDEKTYQITRQINMEYIEANRGATDKIIRYCNKILK